MYNGTNDYNATKLPSAPSEVIVSRTLQSRYRAFSNVVWRAGKPALDSEWNLINDISTEWLSNFIQSKSASGWLNLGQNRYIINSGVANTVQFYSQKNAEQLMLPNAIVNGIPLLIGGVNFIDTSVNSIVFPAAGSSERWDFVFVEVFRAQVRSRDTNNHLISQNKPDNASIYKFGNTQFGGTNLVDDLVDVAISPVNNGLETSERVQVQYRIRVVQNITNSNSETIGFEDGIAQGQGTSINAQPAGYAFTNMGVELGDSGLWRAGNGDQASEVALGTVDGYTYAIPMFKVFRRSTIAYNDTGLNGAAAYHNQQGNATVLASLISDRPDGKFNDGIDASDIIDVRMKINSDDFSRVIEENLDKMLRGRLVSAKNQIVNYDAITNSNINGYTSLLSDMGCNGKRTLWSDASVTQSAIFALVSTTTTSNSLDAYRSVGTGNWTIGDAIVINASTNLPIGTVVTGTPTIYSEDSTKTSISALGTWSGLGTNHLTFTFSSVTGLIAKNIWIYYNLSIPAGQGISNVPDDMYQIIYSNYNAFPNATVVRGARLDPQVTRYEDLFDHPLNNIVGTQTFVESQVVAQSKQILVSPMIQTTTARNSATRTLSVSTINPSTKQLIVPHPIQHLRGVYTSATGGTELATRSISNVNPTSLNISANEILISGGYYVCTLTSLRYDPTGVFSGGEQELLTLYGPVFQHKYITSPYGTRVKLYTATGQPFVIPPTALNTHFRWTGSMIKVRSGAVEGFDINDFIIDCTNSDNSTIVGSLPSGQSLWVDMDYLGAPHTGAQLKLIYSATPYQGADVGGQVLELVKKRDRGLFFNNGTGGSSIGASGTSNFAYTPVSTKLPGSFLDYLRDGTQISILGSGNPRFASDFWTTAAYDVYANLNGGSLWSDLFTMPAVPETNQRGFLGSPMLEVIFELPVLDDTNAEFVLVLLVKNVVTNELLLYVQTGNKGIQKYAQGSMNFDIFHLSERLIQK